MSLTTAQQTIIRNAVNADGTLNQKPHNTDGAYDIAAALNLTDASNTSVWWTATPADNLFNAITWASYTPNDAPDGTATWTNRCLAAQTKQINLQIMLVRQTINMANTTTRAGLRDAVILVPTGAGGAMVAPGGASGVTTLTACIRPTYATRAEKLLTLGPSTTGTVTADVLAFEGNLSYPDVMQAMGW